MRQLKYEPFFSLKIRNKTLSGISVGSVNWIPVVFLFFVVFDVKFTWKRNRIYLSFASKLFLW